MKLTEILEKKRIFCKNYTLPFKQAGFLLLCVLYFKCDMRKDMRICFIGLTFKEGGGGIEALIANEKKYLPLFLKKTKKKIMTS